MSVLRDYLTRRLVFENHPALESARCLNRLQTRNECRACREVCPCGVFDGAEPDWTRCDGCGVCAAACPARAIRPAAQFSARVLELVRNMRDRTVLACSRCAETADLKAPCLAALPWELLALLAMEGEVAVLPAPCAGCPRQDLLAHWEETLSSLRRALGAERFAAHVRILSDTSDAPSEGLSRREAFGRLFSRSRSAAAGLLPDDAALTPDGMLCRRLLAWRWKQRGTETEPLTLSLPTFTDSCNGCGVCTRLCSSEALHRLSGEAEDGSERTAKDVWHMAVIPWRCTGCGLCETACPREGLRMEAQPADLLTPLVHTVRGAACIRCGQPADGGQDGLCAACRAETGTPAFLRGT